jgi:hypothetical protein
MTRVQVVNETEDRSGWSFQVRIAGDAPAKPLLRTLRLSWADYGLWSADGADPPHAVAVAVIRFLLSRAALSELPASFDASTVRRRFADADDAIPELI